MSKNRTTRPSAILDQLARIENDLRCPLSRHEYGYLSTENFEAFYPGATSRMIDAYPHAQTGPDLQNDLEALFEAAEARDLGLSIRFFRKLHPDLAHRVQRMMGPPVAPDVVMTLVPDDLRAPSRDGVDFTRLGLATGVGTVREFARNKARALGKAASPAEQDQSLLRMMRMALCDDVYVGALRQEGEIVAGAIAGNLSDDRGVCELFRAFTVPEKRRRGLALDVCRHLLADRFATGTELVYCECYNPAEATFCAKLGFKRAGTLTDYGFCAPTTIRLPTDQGRAAGPGNPLEA